MILVILGILTWLVIGASSFIYWWTTEFDLTTDEILPIIAASLIGPGSFLMGACIHSNKSKKVLIRQRNEQK